MAWSASDFYLFLAWVLFFLIGGVMMTIPLRRAWRQRLQNSKRTQFQNFALQQEDYVPPKLHINSNPQTYLEIKQLMKLRLQDMRKLDKFVDKERLEAQNQRYLQSPFAQQRMVGAVNLGILGTEMSRIALEKALRKERDYPVKLYIANGLSDLKRRRSLPILIDSLINANRWYRLRVNQLIADYGLAFNDYLPQITNSDRIEIKELIVDFADVYFSEEVKSYLINLIDTRKEAIAGLEELYGDNEHRSCQNCLHGLPLDQKEIRLCSFKGEVSIDYCCRKYKRLPVSINIEVNYNHLVYKAASTLARYFPKTMVEERYLYSPDRELQNIAIRTLGSFNHDENIPLLMTFLKDDNTYRSAVYAFSLILERNPNHMPAFIKLFEQERDLLAKQRLAEVLARRIEYFIMKLMTPSHKTVSEILRQIILLGRTSEIIDFINKNRDIDLENELVVIIKESLAVNTEFKRDFAIYLNERVAKKCGLESHEEIPEKKEENRDPKLTMKILVILGLSLLVFPFIYVLRHQSLLFTTPLMEQFKIFVVDFNYYLAYYSISINGVYLLLLLLSLVQVRKQTKLWRIKNNSLLFKRKMLPSISIIAPAFNEEKTIIESTNSLLHLKYPDVELILVNDGSKDRTLDVLIRYYNLIRVDYLYQEQLKTKSIRGIYMNRSMPKLIVIDKVNGGKADSLNAGINISSKEYFCGIDADSLLEDDALLKLASLTLDEGIETPALGGNIFPINGCQVDHGQIVEVNIPKNSLARFQTIEYIRSFMAGRLGWAKINSLLIISGAFGLFRKDRVIGVGGYLTSSGQYGKDTVGEDMELVVRISRLMRELKQKYRISYAFNANCWTEVPEDLKSLRRQRYRWHRGLVDILTFHQKMHFNPRYGRTGIVAMPYFLIFELFGPFIELQGYVMVFVALFLGLLNLEIALLLFTSTILMGVLISVASLYIAENDLQYFRMKDILTLMLYAVLENFGLRQWISLWRVSGVFALLKKPKGWEKAERKGFASTGTTLKG